MCSILLCGNFHRFHNIYSILSKKTQRLQKHCRIKKLWKNRLQQCFQTIHNKKKMKREEEKKVCILTKLGQFILNNFPGFPLHKIHL